jgi:hypothetical protein
MLKNLLQCGEKYSFFAWTSFETCVLQSCPQIYVSRIKDIQRIELEKGYQHHCHQASNK